MTPRDALDSPETMSVASTHSQLSDRSHYSEPGHHRDRHNEDARSTHSGHSSHAGPNAFAELLNGLLGGGPSIGTSTSRSHGSGGSDDASPANGHRRELSLSSMWPSPLPSDAVSQYVGSGAQRSSSADPASSPGAPQLVGGAAAALDPIASMRAMLGGGGGSSGLPHGLQPRPGSGPGGPLVARADSPGGAASPAGGSGDDLVWGVLVFEEGEGSAPARSVLRGAAHMIGRSKSCKTVLTHGRVSGQHACIFRTTGQVLLEDRSRFGTFLNGELVGKGGSAPVRHGDRIALLAPAKPDGIVFRIELTLPELTAGNPPVTPDTAKSSNLGSVHLAGSPATPHSWGASGVRRLGSAASVASSEAPTEWPTELDPLEGSPSIGSLTSRQPPPGPPPPGPPQHRSPSQYVAAPAQAIPVHMAHAAAAMHGSPDRHMVAQQQMAHEMAAQQHAMAAQQMAQRQSQMMPPPAPFPPPTYDPQAYDPYGQARQPPMGPPPVCAHGGTSYPTSAYASLPACPSLPPGSAYAGSSSGSYDGRAPEVPPLGIGSHPALSARSASSRAPSEGGGVVTGVGAPNANRDISQDDSWQQLQRLQVEALHDVSDPGSASKDPSKKTPIMSRMMRSLSFKTKRSPAKSPRELHLGKRSPRDSQPTSPEGSPRSTTLSREASPRESRLTSIRTQDDAPPLGPNDRSYRLPNWEPGSTKVLDPTAAQRQQRAAPASSGEAAGASAAGGHIHVRVAGGGVAYPGGFEAAYEHAADAAAMELMRCATARGEKFSALVGKVDFLSAVALMISHLGLSLDTPQLEQLFHAVSGGRPSVHFEDFIEADSTKYYLQQLAGVIPTTHLEA